MATTVVDELVRVGVRHVVVAPGSRSTALALAVADRPELTVHVRHDERSAAFVALGIGRATGTPAVVVTTSGTAVTNLAPAIVEADAARVPLLAVTADRPIELHDVGANQTLRQDDLFSGRVRWRTHLPAATGHAHEPPTWRTVVDRAVAAAADGPVHVNVAFREPTVPGLDDGRATAQAYPHPTVGRPDGAPWTRFTDPASRPDVTDLAARLSGRKVLVVAGDTPRPITGLADLTRRGWPVVAEPTAGPRHGVGLAHGSVLLGCRDWLAGPARPDVVLRLGRPTLARAVHDTLATIATVQVTAAGVADPARTAGEAWVVDPALLVSALLAAEPEPPPTGWADRWARGSTTAADLVAASLDGDAAGSAPAVARTVASAAGDRPLVVASSLPIRDLDAYATGTGGRVLANRGVSGIDGLTSTAVGVALAVGPTVALAGDLSFLHDHNGLLVEDPTVVPLTLVVSDNDGGGLFHHVPAVGVESFERLFATPHGRDLVAIAAAAGVPAESVGPDELSAAVAESRAGLQVLVVRTDRHVDADVRATLAADLAGALRP